MIVDDGISIERSRAADSFDSHITAGQQKAVGAKDFVDLMEPTGRENDIGEIPKERDGRVAGKHPHAQGDVSCLSGVLKRQVGPISGILSQPDQKCRVIEQEV